MAISERIKLSRKKKRIAATMLKNGATSSEIDARLKEKYGGTLSTADLAALRKDLKISKNNRKSNPKDVLILQDNGASPTLKQILKNLTTLMQKEKIEWVSINRNGDVKMSKIQDMEFNV